jgi:hypothetical protein
LDGPGSAFDAAVSCILLVGVLLHDHVPHTLHFDGSIDRRTHAGLSVMRSVNLSILLRSALAIQRERSISQTCKKY